ncbi:DNA-binding protein [Methylobacterium sp. NPDC080182]|uniref:DNA-binding protein n=1 Tax=Methylobacterium sp. NPDC080182 TaxID=3390590 RepID=UPI003D067C4B
MAEAADDGDFLYGVPAIAKHMNLKPRQVYHMDATRKIPTFRVGDKVCWSKSAYRRWLAEQEAAARKAPPAEKA